MDRAQEELQFLGCCGIFKQSFKIILKWKTIFSQITAALIIPLFIIIFARHHISQVFFTRYISDQIDNDTSSEVIAKLALFLSFEVAYLAFLILFSLLSTSAVVYTIACIFTAKEISFKKVMSVVPKVWKRLLITFLINYAILFVYHVIAGVLVALAIAFLSFSAIGIAVLVVLVILYICVLAYIIIIWNLASVVSVLEDVKGLKAMKKSKGLVKGHMGVSIALFVLISFSFVGLSFVYEAIVVLATMHLGIKIVVGISCFLLMVVMFLLELVIQTVIYFVCKSYHHENIDTNSLADHLDYSYGPYVRLNAPKDVQLQQVQAQLPV